eukprot:TRINITY_DN9796_c0_g1_i1.p1 TRINITY_DN9796_c0_g1~~TRINITY_DN9796_c0_g1_i1.p1  ORF type:complete len:256 (-),score=55.10 TRINITY_DN9796_c0_g1_i1:258-1025(-)
MSKRREFVFDDGKNRSWHPKKSMIKDEEVRREVKYSGSGCAYCGGTMTRRRWHLYEKHYGRCPFFTIWSRSNLVPYPLAPPKEPKALVRWFSNFRSASWEHGDWEWYGVAKDAIHHCFMSSIPMLHELAMDLCGRIRKFCGDVNLKTMMDINLFVQNMVWRMLRDDAFASHHTTAMGIQFISSVMILSRSRGMNYPTVPSFWELLCFLAHSFQNLSLDSPQVEIQVETQVEFQLEDLPNDMKSIQHPEYPKQKLS